MSVDSRLRRLHVSDELAQQFAEQMTSTMVAMMQTFAHQEAGGVREAHEDFISIRQTFAEAIKQFLESLTIEQ